MRKFFSSVNLGNDPSGDNNSNDPFKEGSIDDREIDGPDSDPEPASDGEVPDIEKLPITSLRGDSFWQ